MTQVLSSPAEAYVRTINDGDAAGFLALFDRDAEVNDAGREIRGVDAIRHWSQTEIFAVQVALTMLGGTSKDGAEIITAKVDGNFDKTGLPDPLVMDFHIRTGGDKIARLACKLAE